MLKDKIMEIKKINVALSARKYNKKTNQYEWNDEKLLLAQNDFKVELNEEDKKKFIKVNPKDELIKGKFHHEVVNSIDKLFQFDEIEKFTGKKKKVPKKESAEWLNEAAELIGLLLKAYGISTSQIRRYLDSLRKIKVESASESFSPSDVLLQQVKIAYAAGKDNNLNFLYEVMKPAIMQGSKDYQYFEQLLRFVEAIVAYHRFYRGEE
jgi:CRISPR-associated protein Csm2